MMWTIKYRIGEKLFLKKTFEITCFVLFTFYIFSIPAFSGRSFYHYISLFAGIIMAVFMLLYVFLFNRFIIDFFTAIIFSFLFSFLISNIVNFSFLLPKSVITQSAMSLVMYQFFRSIDRNKIKVIAPIIIFAGLLFLVYYFKTELPIMIAEDFKGRYGTYFDNENEIAKEFGYIAIISFCSCCFGKKIYNRTPLWLLIIYKILCLLVFGLLFFAILTTGSISNLLTLLFVIFLSVLFKIKKKSLKLIYLVVAAVIIASFVLILQLPALSYFKERLSNMFNTFFNGGQGGDASSNLRLYAFLQYIKNFFLHPLFGLGYGQGIKYTAYNMVAHSTVAELLADIGMLGFLLFEMILFVSFIETFKKKDKFFISFIMIYIIIFQFFISSIYHSKFEYVFIAISFSIFSEKLPIKNKLVTLKKHLLSADSFEQSYSFEEINI